MSLVLEDQSGNGNTLTNSGGAEVTSSLPFAQSTEAVDLERGESDHLYAGDSASLSFTGNFTLECWVKLETLPSIAGEQFFLIAKDDASDRSYALSIFTDDKLRLNFYDGSANNSRIVSDAAIIASTGVWFYVAASVTVGTPTAVLYKDGSSVASTVTANAATTVKNSAVDLVLGALSTKTEGFVDGVVDEFRISNVARDATYISNNYNVHLTTDANHVAYWPFETVSADTFVPKVMMF